MNPVSIDCPYIFALKQSHKSKPSYEGFGHFVLRQGGRIDGAKHDNETSWRLDGDGVLEFCSSTGVITTRFDLPWEGDDMQGLLGEYRPPSGEPSTGVQHALIPLLTPNAAMGLPRVGIVVATNINYCDTTLPLVLGTLKTAGVPSDRVVVVIAQCPPTDEGVVGSYLGWKTVKTAQNSWEYSAMAAVSRHPAEMPQTEYLFFLHDTCEVLHDFWERMHYELPLHGCTDMVVRAQYCTWVIFRKQFLLDSGVFWQGLHGMDKDSGRRIEFGREYCNGPWFNSRIFSSDHRIGRSHLSCMDNPELQVMPYPDKAKRTKRDYRYLGFWKYSRGAEANNCDLGLPPGAAAVPEESRDTKLLNQTLHLLDTLGWRVQSRVSDTITLHNGTK